jgi:diguanylate cyclase (GGDEF)-like protein
MSTQAHASLPDAGVPGARRVTPGRLAKSVCLWGAGFAGTYTLGLAVLGALGMPVAAVPLLSGAITALSFTIWNQRARQWSGPSKAHLRAVDRVSRDLDGVTDPAQLAYLVVSALHKALRPTHLYLWLPMREKRDVYLAAGIGPDPETQALPEAWIQEFFDYLASDDDGHDLPKGGSEFSRWLASRGLNLCLPIISQGRLIGLLTTGAKASGRPYTTGDRWLLNQVLRSAGLALSYLGLQKEEKRRRSRLDNLTHLYRDAQARAITDGLTGLTTHVFFKEQLALRFNEARRHNSGLAMMLVDIDHFKGFNDTFGHQVGDEVLRQVSNVVKSAARSCDTVARYGGEELALVLPQTDLEGASILAERIRVAIESIEITDKQGRRLPTITASIGVADLELADSDPDGLIARADKALYAAKHNGRNQVVQAS